MTDLLEQGCKDSDKPSTACSKLVYKFTYTLQTQLVHGLQANMLGTECEIVAVNIAEFRPRAIWMFNACTNQCAAWFFHRIIIWAYTFARECSPGTHCFQDVENRPPTHRLLITLPINGMAVAKTT